MMNNKPIETELDILLQAENLLANHKWYYMYEFMGSFMVALFPQKEYYLQHKEEYKELSFLLDKMEEWTFNVNFSAEGFEKWLLSFFRNRAMQNIPLSSARTFARNFFSIDSVDDKGALIFNTEWTKIFCSSWGIPKGTLYLRETIDVNSQVSVQTAKKNTENENPVKTTVRKRVAQTESEKKLEDFWFKITNDNFDYKYLWKNKLGTEEFEELKVHLIACSNEGRIDFVKRFARAILLYIAEWYKRCYSGKTDKNAIETLKLECKPKEIWEAAQMPNSLLYKKKNNMYLFSMYVLGGLPIRYLTNKRFKDIFKEISSAYKKKEDEEQINNNIFINNHALQESMRSQWGSLHLYFDALMRDEYPFSASDLEKEPFKNFIENLKEWNPMRNKFKIEWLIEGNLRNKKLRRLLRLYVTPETAGERHKSISYARLEKWCGNKDYKSFNLYLCFNEDNPEETDEQSEHLSFYNTYDGYFVGQMTDNFFTFTHIPSTNIRKIKLVGKFGHRFKVVDEFNIQPYLQLFETNRYGILSSNKNDRKNYVLLPYDYKILHPVVGKDGEKYFTDDVEPYRMIENNTYVSFKDAEDEDITLYGHVNGINVSFKRYTDVLLYDDEGMCQHSFLDANGKWQEEKIPVIFNAHDIKVVKCMENEEPEELSFDKYQLEFKADGSNNYQSWTDENSPKRGVCKIRVVMQGCKYVQKVYVLPSPKCPIKRDCKKRKIGIDASIDMLEYPYDFYKTEFLDGRNINWYEDKLDNCYSKDQICIKFGIDKDFLSLKVHRACIVKKLYRDGELIESYRDGVANSSLEIPIMLKDHFSVRYIGGNGVFNMDLKDEEFSIFDLALDDNFKSITKSIKKDSEVGVLKFYLCKDNGDKDKHYLLDIDDDDNDNYVFYYWSMMDKDQPELLSFHRDGSLISLNLSEDQKERGMIFQSLENGVVPRHYFAPYLIGTWNEQSVNSILNCVFIAMEHHIAFRCFEPIYQLFKETDSSLTDLSADVFLHENGMSLSQKMEGLIRLSREFYFSWPLLNRRTWKEMPERVYGEKINNSLSKIDKQTFTEFLRTRAKNLFCECGRVLSTGNRLALEEFTEFYWATEDESGVHFAPFGDNRWYGYSINGDKELGFNEKDMPVMALVFMRPRPINDMIHVLRENDKHGYVRKYPRIIGFTNGENKTIRRDEIRVRPINEIVDFLKWLNTDKESFISIVRFLKMNLCK